jgi:hypothetical protein
VILVSSTKSTSSTTLSFYQFLVFFYRKQQFAY